MHLTLYRSRDCRQRQSRIAKWLIRWHRADFALGYAARLCCLCPSRSKVVIFAVWRDPMKDQVALICPALCHRAMIASLLLGLGCAAGGCDATPAHQTTTPEVAPPSI